MKVKEMEEGKDPKNQHVLFVKDNINPFLENGQE